ncbi:MAG: HRDC domain-containing protein, partial [Planctomycetes bacterium]|nr:HRDC domain-containing protein [Planctomycetota bacterium]
RDMARLRPSDHVRLLEVKGIGEKKSRQYGQAVLAAIKDYCHASSIDMDVDGIPL